MFKITESDIPGCFLITFRKMDDLRGSFIKTFHEAISGGLNLPMQPEEEYFSLSSRNVFRGMHFQVPPTAISKTMYCVIGKVTDYVVDLRRGSPTFGKHASFELNAATPEAVFVPIGLAHGFFVHSDTAIMQCKSSGVYDSSTDVTISYKGFGFAAEIENPVLSERDLNALDFASFDSPFIFEQR